MNCHGYGVMYVCGMPKGTHSCTRVVRPRTSFAVRTMRNFSAPAFSSGGVAPAGRPALPYTPLKSGCPSILPFASGRAVVLEVGLATGAPDTVTVTVRETVALAFSVYVVVCAGDTCLLPRTGTDPTSGSIVSDRVASVCQ